MVSVTTPQAGPRSVEPAEPVSRRPDRHRRYVLATAIVVIAVIAAAVAAIVIHASGSGSHKQAAARVDGVGRAARITLTDGTISVGALASRLEQEHRASLLAKTADGAYQLAATVVVAAGAVLTADHVPLLLRSDSEGSARILVSGGAARFTYSTITSWNGAGGLDSTLSDGRSDLIVSGTSGSIVIDHCDVAALGATVDRPGLSVAGGASATVLASSFTGLYRGLDAHRSGRITISGSQFKDSVESGAVLGTPGAGSRVSSSTFDSSGASGLEIDHSTDATLADVSASRNVYSGIASIVNKNLVVRGGDVFENGNYGISLVGTGSSTVTGMRSYANNNGVQVDTGKATIDGSFVSGNKQNGIFVGGSTATLTITATRVDHNNGDGLWISDGTVSSTASTYDTNRTGIYIADTSPHSTLVKNVVTGSPIDGVALTTTGAGVLLTDNTIEGSGKAAFSVLKRVGLKAVTPIKTANKVVGDQAVARIRNG